MQSPDHGGPNSRPCFTEGQQEGTEECQARECTIKLGLKMPSWGDCVQNGLEDTGVNAGESVRVLLQ